MTTMTSKHGEMMYVYEAVSEKYSNNHVLDWMNILKTKITSAHINLMYQK